MCIDCIDVGRLYRLSIDCAFFSGSRLAALDVESVFTFLAKSKGRF